MTNKRFLHPATLFFLLTLLVALLSWVGSIYGWSGVQNLISAEGLRWKLRNVGDGLLAAPFFGDLLLLSFGVGLCLHSGFWEAVKGGLYRGRKLSRKELRSLWLSLTVGIVYILAVLFLVLDPWGMVRSITGGLKGSPLSEGISYLLSLGLGIVAVIYGYTVDLYRTDRDIIKGMSYSSVRFSGYCVTLFFVVQFFTSLHYTGLDVFFGLSSRCFQVLYAICCILPLFLRKSIFG